MNMSRIVGPVVAGMLLASFGSQYVFLLNALLSATVFVIILRWRSQPKASALPGERFFGAMWSDCRHVLQSPRIRVVLHAHLLFLPAIEFVARAVAADRPAGSKAAPPPSPRCWRRWVPARWSLRCFCRACVAASRAMASSHWGHRRACGGGTADGLGAEYLAGHAGLGAGRHGLIATANPLTLAA